MSRRLLLVLSLMLTLVSSCQRRGALDPRLDGEVIHLDDAPPALSGGTLTVLADGVTALIADPDRDRVMLVDIGARTLTRTITLPAGSEPGRSTEDAAGRVHVVLRGTGEVLTFDPHALDDGTRRPVCPMPRGVAYDPTSDAVVVACRGGEVVDLPASGGAITQLLTIRSDLRDVLVVSGRRFVTTFREAHLLEISAFGSVLSDRAPNSTTLVGASGSSESYSASVAWRTIVTADGIAMVHQRGRTSSIVVAHTSPSAPSGYGAPSGSSVVRCPSSVVHGAVSFFDLEGGAATGGGVLANAVLPVDLAAHGGELTLVAAGNQAGANAFFTGNADSFQDQSAGCASGVRGLGAAASTAVAYDPSGTLLRLERDPSVLVIGSDRVELGGVTVFDTGHALFHGNVGSQVACASCHPEGGEDGRVWTFDFDPRRTQTIGGGLSATAPFHWDGAEHDMGAIVGDVMVRRMRGTPLSDDQLGAFSAWIDAIPAVHGEVHDSEAVARGRVLFEGTAGCAGCHSGEHLTSNANENVGTDGMLQVPSLVGVSLRLPLMRSGCAVTLADRFDPTCGGAMHGHPEALDAADLGDLTAYLTSL